MSAWIAVATGAAAVLFAVAAVVLARRGAVLEGKLRQARADRGPEVAGSLDPDDVVARILDNSLAVPGIDAAVLSLEGDERGGMVKSAGMSREEAERQGELGSKLSVPLEGELGLLGTLSVYSGTFSQVERQVGDEIAGIVRRAVPALDNAFRYREARRLADLDALTGLRNRRFFHETLQREVTELTESDNATTFFERADDALYQAKQAGKAQLAKR